MLFCSTFCYIIYIFSLSFGPFFSLTEYFFQTHFLWYVDHVTTAGSLGGQLNCDNQSINSRVKSTQIQHATTRGMTHVSGFTRIKNKVVGYGCFRGGTAHTAVPETQHRHPRGEENDSTVGVHFIVHKGF